MELRDYQKDIASRGLLILQQYKILYLAMEVRTGKTITSLTIANDYGAKSVLFITPKKAISSIDGDYQLIEKNFRITLTNYEQLHNINSADHDFIIIDEAHRLGQFPKPAIRTKNLQKIAYDKPVIFLSGTPTPESYSQIFHQLWVSSNSPFAGYVNFYKWAAEYVTIKKKYFYNREMNDYSCANKEKIDEKISHLFISYSQAEAGFEQFVKEEILYVDLKPATHALAKRLIKDRVYTGTSGNAILADTEVKLQIKLHQLYSGSIIDETGNGHIIDRSKALFIRSHFEDKKIAIFYNFKEEAVMLISVFGYDRLTDDPVIFNESDRLIFYSQIKSGREGINLSTADALVMLNIDFSAVSYWQSRARIQSKDREKECLLYWIFSRGGIEEKIYKVVADKRDYTLSYFKKDYGISTQKKVPQTT